MMPKIDAEARKVSRISHEDTMLMDSKGVNFAKALDEPAIIKLIEKFFELVEQDDETWFTDIYKHSEVPRDELVQSYFEYLIQRLGGPPYYSERAGHPNLISLHSDIGIDVSRKNKWLSLMEDAMDTMDHIFDGDVRSHLMMFFSHCCTSYVVGTNEAKKFACARLYDDDFMVNRIPDPEEPEEEVVSSSGPVDHHHNFKK